MIRSKAFSTFDLLPPEEYARRPRRAPRPSCPSELEYHFDWLLAGASR